MLVIFINGVARSGKDTFCEYMRMHARCKAISVADKPKEALRVLGWNGDKSDEFRKYLSDLCVMGESLNTDENYLRDSINECKNNGIEILFLHCREPKNIIRFQKICNEENIKSTTLLITTNRVEQNMSNIGDRSVFDMEYEITIPNNGTLNELYYSAKEFKFFLKDLGLL